MRAAFRTKAIAVVRKRRVEEWLQDLQHRLLNHPVHHRRDTGLQSGWLSGFRGLCLLAHLRLPPMRFVFLGPGVRLQLPSRCIHAMRLLFGWEFPPPGSPGGLPPPGHFPIGFRLTVIRRPNRRRRTMPGAHKKEPAPTWVQALETRRRDYSLERISSFSGKRPSATLEKINLPSTVTSKQPPSAGNRISCPRSSFLLCFRISAARPTACLS